MHFDLILNYIEFDLIILNYIEFTLIRIAHICPYARVRVTLLREMGRLVDLDEEELLIPDNIKYDLKCRVGTALIRSWRHKTAVTKGMVTFNASKTRFELIATSDEWGSVNIQQPLPSVTALIVESNDDMTHTVTIGDKSMGSIDTMVQCTPGVDVGFKDGMPLSITGYFDKDKKSYITLWVAPCETDDMQPDED